MAQRRYLHHLIAFSCAWMSVSSPMAAEQIEQQEVCSDEVILKFFPKEFVRVAFTENGIPEDQWIEIMDNLKQREGEVMVVLREKAGRMDPNPLENYEHAKTAAKLLRESQLEVLTRTMNQAGITDQRLIEKVMTRIQEQKARRFAECLKDGTVKSLPEQLPSAEEPPVQSKTEASAQEPPVSEESSE